ncbi:hypothetical protein D3C87_1596280 [compost metagenome]
MARWIGTRQAAGGRDDRRHKIARVEVSKCATAIHIPDVVQAEFCLGLQRLDQLVDPIDMGVVGTVGA